MELHARLRAGVRILELQSALLDSVAEIRRTDEALAEARRREIEFGARIQQTLLVGQPPPAIPGVSIAALSSPSQEIDGDFTDFVSYDENCFDLLIGDVMGKGVPAALMGAAVKTQFVRVLCEQLSSGAGGALPTPERLVSAVHRAVTGRFIGLERFITLCYARFDLRAGRLSLVDCGHTGTIHLERASGRVNLCYGDNMPLGFSVDEEYHERSIPIQAGDLFLFYSDGITEALGPNGEVFGVERLVDIVSVSRDLEVPAILDRITTAVRDYTGPGSQPDDLTAIAVRVNSIAALQRAEVEIPSQLSALPALRAFVSSFCLLACPVGTGPSFVEELELAASESATNIIKHAYGGSPDYHFMVRAEAFPGQVTIRFDYGGESFDPSHVEPPSFDGSRDGGFGLYLIASTVDEARYSSGSDGQNVIVLEKQFEGAR
ncbi:MAG: SpoIIE family protein phosphatase [Chloroflexi bacterium]|nr:SpoIIE family protein phosphatase [Chloroflexota bacterium]